MEYRKLSLSICPATSDLGLWLTLVVEHSMQCAATFSHVAVWKPRLGGTQFALQIALAYWFTECGATFSNLSKCGARGRHYTGSVLPWALAFVCSLAGVSRIGTLLRGGVQVRCLVVLWRVVALFRPRRLWDVAQLADFT